MIHPHHISKTGYQIRCVVLILAAFTPSLCWLSEGYLPSLSSYWRTPIQPLFIISNAITSFYLYSMIKWKYSALMLLALTAFSIDMYPISHNSLAILFFIVNLIPLYQANNFKFCFWLYGFSLLLLPYSMMYMETAAIIILCLYHGLVLDKIYKLQKER